MRLLRTTLIVLILLTGLNHLWAQDESFESASVPAHWSSTGLSTATNHYKHGSRSLKWDWTGGDNIDVTDIHLHGLNSGELHHSEGGFHFNTFELWIYNEEALPDDSLIIEFFSSAMVLKYYYHVQLDFTGWRAAKISYSYDMLGSGPDEHFIAVENMRIVAPESGAGTLYFDRIDYTTNRNTNKEADFQMPYVNGEPYNSAYNHWQDMMYTMELPITEPLVAPSPSELDDINGITTLYDGYILGNAPSAGAVSTAISNYTSLNITVVGDEVEGKPLFGKNHGSAENIYQIERILHVFARDFKHTGNPLSYERFMNTVKYMLDQGFTKGSMMETIHHIGYDFRNIPKAVFLMREELADEDIWDEAYAMVEWYVNFYVVWDPEAGNSNMDEANTRVLEKLGVALYRNSNADKLQALKGVRNYIENWVLPESNITAGVKPDYSGFHHSASYPGYSYHAYKSLAHTAYFLSGTSLAVSDETRVHLKRCLLSARVGFGGGDIPYGMYGRKAFTTTPIKWGLYYLGVAEPEDADLLAAFNKMYGVTGGTEMYPEEDLPNGFWQFNYAPMGVYRQANWVTPIKGFKKGLWGTEIYTTENRFGRYQSYGSINVYYDGGREASGYRADGWDWNKVPGTTVIALSMADLNPSANRADETTESVFCGSLRYNESPSPYYDTNLEGELGMFAMDFQQDDVTPTHNTSFRFRKSVFCYNGVLVCMGAGIQNDDLTNRTQTNVFQLSVAGETQAPILNGVEISSYPYSNTLPEGSTNWLIDNYGTGYYLADVPDVQLNGITQVMPDHKNTYTASGNFFSAYLDHGLAPTDEDYTYAILPGISEGDMTSFVSDMSSPDTEFYTVFSSASSGHVIKFNENNVLAYALFEPNSDMGYGRVLDNASPCLVFEEELVDTLILTVGTPDLKTDFDSDERDSELATLDFVLDGEWYLYSAIGGDVVLSDLGTGETAMSVEVMGGDPIDIILIPEPESPVADFSYSAESICQGDSVNFTDESLFDPTAWIWEFGDGGTSDEENPWHTFNSPGVYSVTLNVTNDFGTDLVTFEDIITIHTVDTLIQSFEICEGDAITIGENTYDASGEYVDLFSSIQGCDSVVITELIVHELPDVTCTPDESVVDGEICRHAGVVMLEGTPEGGVFLGTGVVFDDFFDPLSAGFGMHEINYEYTDENGCTNNATVMINVIDCIGIGEQEKIELDVFLNPNLGTFTVSNLHPTDELKITDELGRLVHSSTIDNQNTEIYLQGWSPGIYTIEVIRGNSSAVKRMVVLRRN